MSKQSGFIGALDAVSAALDRVTGWLCALLFGAMTLAVLAGVFFRFVLNSPLSWPEEASRYLMIWGASAAISLGVRADEHVGLTMLFDALKIKALRVALAGIVFLAVLGFSVFMLVYSIQFVIESDARQTLDLGFSMLLPTLAVPVAMALTIVQLVLMFVLRASRGFPGSGEIKVIDI